MDLRKINVFNRIESLEKENEELKQWKHDVNEKLEKLGVLSSNNDKLRSAIVKLNKEIKTITSENSKLKEAVSQLDEKVKRHNKRVDTMQFVYNRAVISSQPVEKKRIDDLQVADNRAVISSQPVENVREEAGDAVRKKESLVYGYYKRRELPQQTDGHETDLSAKFENLNLQGQNKNNNLYVKNLDDDIDDERLHKEFSRFGNILSAKVMRNENKTSKHFGFVCFSSDEEAKEAIIGMNGRLVENKALYVALYQRKEDRRTFLKEQAIEKQELNDMAIMSKLIKGSPTPVHLYSHQQYPPPLRSAIPLGYHYNPNSRQFVLRPYIYKKTH